MLVPYTPQAFYYIVGENLENPLRLIELFAGYGSQALALKYLGIPFEHHFVCEFDKYAIQSYNDIHGTDFEVSDIKNISAEDLNITDTENYKYLLTYSFPCTDLSMAGKRKGMQRESGTSSSLLWEVERLLKECKELPQYLLMENVPQVIGKNNISLFGEWCQFLTTLGYTNYYKLLNAKDFGIPQNRERCFMVSILQSENKEFVFPNKQELTKSFYDIKECVVDEKLFLSNDVVHRISKWKSYQNPLNSIISDGIVPTITARGAGELHSGMQLVFDDFEIDGVGGSYKYWRNIGVVNVIPTIKTSAYLAVALQNKLRKITPRECFRLMGVKDKDYNKLSCSDPQKYKQAGNSIVVDVLMAIFENMFIKDCKSNKLF